MPVQLGALRCILRQVAETGVPLFCLPFLFVWLPVLLLLRPLLAQHDAAIVYAHARPPRILRNVPPHLAVLVTSGQLGERAKAHVEEILLGGRRRLWGLIASLWVVRLAGALQPQVVELGVDALLGGGLEAPGVQAGEQGPLLRREHVQGVGSLLQAQLTALHAADGGGPLELVVDLDAQAPSGFTQLCADIRLPLSCMSFKLPDLWKGKEFGTDIRGDQM